MSTDITYDHSGLAPRLCALIWRCGAFVLEVTSRDAVNKADCCAIVVTWLAELRKCSEDVQKGIDQLIGEQTGWLPSLSLGVAVQDTWLYIEELEEFQPGGPMHDWDDDYYVETLRDLAAEMYTRDHALEFAMRNNPDRAAVRSSGQFAAVPRNPEAATAPGESNVVQLDRFRRRRPASTDNSPAA